MCFGRGQRGVSGGVSQEEVLCATPLGIRDARPGVGNDDYILGPDRLLGQGRNSRDQQK